ncbi:hypothetical protein OIU79_009997 [Salix purpurea]|uniref:Uncharacterized protein n=1 Tax=Salix purpurea TaxID=77065 RepID=A0A9Q0QEZ0_SALPP|nr:hypothetical protein OIU79_009997 [Salix purpurea]
MVGFGLEPTPTPSPLPIGLDGNGNEAAVSSNVTGNINEAEDNRMLPRGLYSDNGTRADHQDSNGRSNGSYFNGNWCPK